MNKELIRRALMGDKQAQEDCTAKGIALPCPCCGRPEQAIINGSAVYHVYADCSMGARFVPLHKWNARPAPPIGRCRECAAYIDNKCSNAGYYKTEQGYCDDFEPRED